MEIRLDQIGDPHFEWRERLSFAEEDLGHSGLQDLGEVDCRGTIDLTTSGYVLRFRLKYRQTTVCGRCLEPLAQDMDGELDLLIVTGEAEDGDETELEREDLGVMALTEPVLDTRPLVFEQIQLGIPMKPLCREECAGLCSQCGANLNQETCRCQPEQDPRWSALAALRGGAES